MITVGMNYEVIEGKQEEFEKMFAKVLSVMKEIEGHGESHLFVDVAQPSSYLIISQWTSEQAFDDFISSDRFKNVTNWGKEKILASRPKHEVYGRQDQTPQSSCPAH
ncbi:MAG: antibiotic biosynthesis monooxygenase [Phycisphaerae bacterium]